MNELDRKYEDEIELIDIFRVIWKWKYLIVAGTLFCMIAAALVSSLMAKTYKISMILEPGFLKIQEDGGRISVDSPNNIKALIESGAFDINILESIRNSNNNYVLNSLRFKVDIPKGSETIKIMYETSDEELGVRVLKRLGGFLQKKYDELVQYSKKEYEKQVALKRTEIEDVEAQIQSEKKRIKNFQNRINELRSKMELIKNNSQALIQERNKFLSNSRNENNILSSLLYMNTIQQNLQVEDRYMQELQHYISAAEDSQLKLDNLNTNLKRLLEKIKNLEYKKEKIQNIQVVQNPRKEPIPVSPKKKLNVLLAAVFGLFFMIFLAFLLEYLQKHKEGQNYPTNNHK